MAIDVSKVHQQIAENLLYDMRQPTTAAGLNELHQEAMRKDSPLVDYPAWKKAFDLLIKEVGIKRDGVHGFTAPDGLKPEGVARLTLDQVKLLASFGSTETGGSRKLVQSARANIVLGDFHRHYAPLFLSEIHEKALHNAADKITHWWHKYVETLVEMTKDNKYFHHKQLVEQTNQLAKDVTFAGSIGTGFAKPEHFTVDPEKLRQAVAGQHSASSAVSQFGNAFFSLSRTAAGHSHYNYENQMKQMQMDYFRDVKPALEEYKNLDKTLSALAQQHSRP